MDSLLSAHLSPPSLSSYTPQNLRHPFSKSISFSLRPYTPPPLKSSLTSQQPILQSNSKTPNSSLVFDLEEPSNLSLLLASAPQTPATAMRGAESDAMGLLLRERIVFLGNNIDDFVADAIISQLLLLDAQDPTKDIRLFVNSPGGSLRYRYQLGCRKFNLVFYNGMFPPHTAHSLRDNFWVVVR
ncbi:unnamed protein product [Ilex paraguariensis]|uniref:ATP-dependent Clp protease proteolytic subunit n=1 Tax=Ilex paraguariensis TaxID=185542 RepID=A0ABC8UD00_9AQUA